MAQQRVPGGDMDGFLDVRWANEDPNPRAQARVKREHARAFSQVAYTKPARHSPLHSNIMWRDRAVVLVSLPIQCAHLSTSYRLNADHLYVRAQPLIA